MRKNRILSFSLIILFIFLLCSNGYTLTKDTHRAINEYIAERTVSGFSLDDYLKYNLGFSKGKDEPIKGKEVYKWVGDGGEKEDIPGEWYDYVLGKPTRSVNHFHNPLIENWDDAGLDDWVLFFHYTGQSSVLWSQNPDQDPDQNLGGEWSWQDAREYYYIALTGR